MLRQSKTKYTLAQLSDGIRGILMREKRKKISLSLLIILLALMVWPSSAMADVLTDGLPQINASSYVVIEGSTGEILFGQNYALQTEPASTAMIMTAVLAIEKGDMERIVTIESDIPEAISGGNAINVMLRKGEKQKLGDLLKVAMLHSANDAAWVVAESIGGSEEKFVKLMNDKAKELGMKNTTFKNSNGLAADGQWTTAEDLAILGRYAMTLPTFREIVGLDSFIWKSDIMTTASTYKNINPLLDIMPEAIGIKNGYNETAKNTIVGAAEKDGRELIGVILGGSDGTTIGTDMKTLLDYGFNNTKIIPVVQKEASMTNVAFGEDKQIRVVAGESMSLVRPSDNSAIVETTMTLNDIKLPIKKDQQVGVLDVRVDGVSVGQVPLVSMDDAKGSIPWLLLFTSIMTILYILQMIVRAMRLARKSGASRPAASVVRERETMPVREPSASAQRKSLGDRTKKNNDTLKH